MRENQTSLGALTVDVHLDPSFLFHRAAIYCAHVKVFILKTDRIHGQDGRGLIFPHLRTERTVYLGSPRERWGRAACGFASQGHGAPNLSHCSIFRGDLNFKCLS